MTEEIKQILKMVEGGHITAGEAEKLMMALEGTRKKSKELKKSLGRFIYIEINNDRDKSVKITLPIKVAQTFIENLKNRNQSLLQIGEEIDFNLNDLLYFIKSNYVGECANIKTDNADVRIWIA